MAFVVGECEAGLSVDEERSHFRVAVLGSQVQRGRFLLVHRVNWRSSLQFNKSKCFKIVKMEKSVNMFLPPCK